MKIANRLSAFFALSLLALSLTGSPSSAADVLQCVPYARALSGVRIHGDAWTWWEQAKGHYRRGTLPRPGAVLSLANTETMPLGHVAVVSQIVDDRRILLRHANWSAPGLIERDVLAVDASPRNDWSEVRIWWGQTGQMGARINPVNGFIYPNEVNDPALLAPDDRDRFAVEDSRASGPITTASARLTRTGDRSAHMGTRQPLSIDLSMLREGQDLTGGNRQQGRTLAMILGDVRREARLR